jgi:hypothetical protein
VSWAELSVDPTGFYQPHDVAKFLDDTRTVLIDETPPRTAPASPGTDHTRDHVLRTRAPDR